MGFFRTERDGGVAHLIMDRADKANAMNAEFWEELPQAVGALAADPEVRAIVLSGEGRHFTAGMDLSAFQGLLKLTEDEPARGAYAMRDMILRLQGSLTALESARVPVICAIHGACMGGGIDLITAADIRLASRDAYFGIEEINIAITADVGTLQRLPKLIAPSIVRELALTGRRFTAEEAHGWGLVGSLHEDRAAVIGAALEMARGIASKSPLAVAGIKRALTYARDHSVEDGLDQVATWNAGMLRPEDLMEAMRARMSREEGRFRDLAPEARLTTG